MVISQNLTGYILLFFLPFLVFLYDVPVTKIRNKIRASKGLPAIEPKGLRAAVGGKRVWIFDTVAVAVIGYMIGLFVLAPLAQRIVVYHKEEGYSIKNYYAYGHVESFQGVAINTNNRDNIILINKNKQPLEVREWRYEKSKLTGTQPLSTTILYPDEMIEVTKYPWLFGENPPSSYGEDQSFSGILPTICFYESNPANGK